MISIADLAERVGVSKSTVSRALSPDTMHLVKAETREKILAICRQLQYVPMTSARALSSGRSHVVGLILADIVRDFASPYLSETIAAILDALKERNYALKMIPVSPPGTAEADREVLDALRSRGVDGFILGSGVLGEATRLELKRLDVPALALYTPSQTAERVKTHHIHVDNVPALRELLRHLRFCGHRKVAYLAGEDKSETPRAGLCLGLARTEGLNMTRLGLDYISSPLQAIHSARAAVLRAWDRLHGFTAWVCQNDLLALGAVEALREKNVAIGREIAVAGYDNIEDNPNYTTPHPILTTIAPPRDKLGREAVAVLMDLIENPRRPCVKKSLEAKLIIRETT